MKNKKNNKGFSLVELIVVVAIMAVLVGVLAPAYLKYVESSREKKDVNNLEEVRHAVEIALAEEGVFEDVVDGTTVTINRNTGAISTTVTDLGTELAATVGTTCELVSKTYSSTSNTAVYTITIDLDNGVSVTGDWPAIS